MDKMKYMHYRRHGSTSICNHDGVHTTKKESAVTCENCKAKLGAIKNLTN